METDPLAYILEQFEFISQNFFSKLTFIILVNKNANPYLFFLRYIFPLLHKF